MRKAILALLFVVAACEAKQPESGKMVAAFEVPLLTESDRATFLLVLRHIANVEGLHLDAADQQELKETAKAIPLAKMTVKAAVWRGSDDDHPEAVIMDGYDHMGRVWVDFLKGEDPTLARRFREHAMREIRSRWPATLPLPITPTGGLPLPGDLLRTPGGYIIKPSEASKYANGR